MIAKPQVVAKFAELGAEPLGGTPKRAAAFIGARARAGPTAPHSQEGGMLP